MYRYYIFDCEIIFDLSRDVYLGRLDFITILFGCVVENDVVRVVVMTAVWNFEVGLFPTIVVTVAVLMATVDMRLVICTTR